MKIYLKFLFFSFLPFLAHGQLTIEWQKCLGGTTDDSAYTVRPTNDGGYIVAGFALSNNGDVQGAHGGGDLWVVKLDEFGAIEWKNALGGNSSDIALSVQQTSDGGYFAAGRTISNNGDVSGNHGGLDYWIVKLDSMGNLEWQKALGGSLVEELNYAEQTDDGGFILAGYSFSMDGDVSVNYGNFDYWVVKLNALGDIEWEKTLGGSSGVDIANCVRQTSDGGYIVAGESESTDGDVTGNHGSTDYWVVKLNAFGEIQWQTSLGGIALDVARWVSQTNDGGYLVVGESGSYNNGQIMGAHGSFDVWVVKLSATGGFLWQKAIGGSDEDYGRVVEQIDNNRILIGRLTNSTNGDVQDNDGGVDFWVLILNKSGAIVMQKTLGGSDTDICNSIHKTSDGGFILAGETRSNDGDVSGNHGVTDYWVIKLASDVLPTSEPESFPLEIYPNPASNIITLKTETESSNLVVRITDQVGHEVLCQTISTFRDGTNKLDVSIFPAGIYLISATDRDGKVFLGKLSKLE